MEVREFRREDAPKCIEIMHENFRRFGKSRGGYLLDENVEEKLIKPYTASALLEKARKNRYWVAEHGGEVFGLIGLRREDEESAEVVNFYVNPERTRTGIGKALLNTLKAHAVSRGLSRLFTHSALTAHNAYENTGFTHKPEKDVYLEKGHAAKTTEEHNARYFCKHIKTRGMRQKGAINQYYFEMALPSDT